MAAISDEELEQFFERRGLDINEEETIRYVLRGISWRHFSECYFPNPEDPEEKLKWEEWQGRALDWIQFGRDSRHGIFKCPRGFGKSWLIAGAVACAMLWKARTEVGVFSTSQWQSEEVIGKIHFFFDVGPYRYMKSKFGNNKQNVTLINGSRCVGFSSSGKTIRGFHPEWKFMDEQGQMDADYVNKVVRPMGRKKFYKECGFGTPFFMQGPFYEAFNNMIMTDCKDCGHHVDNEKFKSCPDCGSMNVRHAGEFKVFNISAYEVSWITEEDLRRERAILGDLAFRQEMLGEFLPTGGTFFNMMAVKESYDLRLKLRLKGEPRGTYYLATDFGKQRDNGCIIIFHMVGEFMVMDWIETHLRWDYPMFNRRILQLCDLFRVAMIIPDGMGVGIAALDYLEQETEIPIYVYNPNRGKGFVYSNKEKFQILSFLNTGFETKHIVMPWHENVNTPVEKKHLWEIYMLEKELMSFEYEWGETNIKLGTQSEKDDRVMALAYGHWAARRGIAQIVNAEGHSWDDDSFDYDDYDGVDDE